MTLMLTGSLPILILVYAALYGAYGTESPFLPSFLAEHGLSAAAIGIVLAAGTAVRLVTGPLAGLVADRFAASRPVLGSAAATAGALSLAYLPAHGFWPLLTVSMAHSVAIAPLAPLADAVATGAAKREGTFSYGWVRGAGSAAFIAGTLLSGVLVGRFGLASIIVSSGALLVVMAVATSRLPAVAAPSAEGVPVLAVWRSLFATPRFASLLAVAALVSGSHAVNDTFAVIRWRNAGIDPRTIGLLWSASVAAEIVVFVLVGPALLRRIGPARCAALAAAAGIVRWGVMATTTAVPILAVSQLGHGFTFALLHLVAMALITEVVLDRLRASAQTIYAFALGGSSIGLTLVSGAIYDRLGGSSFWVMAALCGVALPLTPKLRDRGGDHHSTRAEPSGSA